MRGPRLQWAVMTLRVLLAVLVALLVVLPAAQQASAPLDAGHATALKHAPRTPPSSARVAVAVRLVAAPAAPTFVAPAPSAPPDRVSGGAPAAPFVPPRV